MSESIIVVGRKIQCEKFIACVAKIVRACDEITSHLNPIKCLMKLVANVICINEDFLIISTGFYWVFTIIITACYTGSIIAFVTLPIFPETVDTLEQLQNGFYRIGTLDRGGWERWFLNSSQVLALNLSLHQQNIQIFIHRKKQRSF